MSRKEENKEIINIIAGRSSIILTGTHEDVTRFYLSSISSILTDISTSLAIIADSMSSPTMAESEEKNEL